MESANLDITKRKLDLIAKLEREVQGLRKKCEQELDEVLTPEQREQFDEIRNRYTALMLSPKKQISELTEQVKGAALENKTTIKGTTKGASKMVVYTPQKYKWDNKMLEGYAIDNPGVLDCREKTKPKVSLRNF